MVTEKLNSKSGFTLVEVMVATGILAFVISQLLSLFIYTSTQAELAGNKTTAVSKAQNKIEEIRNYSYASIPAAYASGGAVGNSFSVSPLQGMGVVYIDSSNVELLTVETDVSWRNKYGRIVGEDTNLNGAIDAGEDVNGNGKLDSPIKLVSMITRR